MQGRTYSHTCMRTLARTCTHRIEEGLRIKPDSWEAVGSLAQLEWERAKAKLSYVLQSQ